uniref:DUF4939 domain-containing protein n=1 Tax=Scleropages formosus TaxID=113540 RepID=A0A8C9T0X9_SCLFO
RGARWLTTNAPRLGPFITTPEMYDGSPEQCSGFLMQCELVFPCFPHLYSTEESKITYLVALLTGRAHVWAMVGWSRHQKTTYAFFLNKFKAVFSYLEEDPEPLQLW